MRTTKLAVAAAAVALLAVAPGSALAANSTVTGTVSAGALTLTNNATSSFSATLDGTDQSKNYTIPSVITDARGNNAGWNLTITSTQFSTGGGTPSTLATNASTVTGVTNACVSGTTCTNPTNSTTYPVGVPAGTTPPTAVKYFNAATSSGKGKFDNVPTVAVALPASVDAGSYTSTVTLAAVTGP